MSEKNISEAIRQVKNSISDFDISSDIEVFQLYCLLEKRLYLEQSDVLISKKDFEKSVEALNCCLDVNRSELTSEFEKDIDFHSLVRQSLCYSELLHLEKALQCATKALDLKPRHSVIFNLLKI